MSGTITISYVAEHSRVIDVSGIASWDAEGDPGNFVRNFHIGAGSRVTGIAWDVTLEAYTPSYLSEIKVGYGASTGGADVILTPGPSDTFPGVQSYMGSADLAGLGLSFDVGQDGIMRLEFFEGFDDFPDAADGQWVSGTLTITYVPAPSVIIDMDGILSWDGEGDPDNVVHTYNIGANSRVTGVYWDTSLLTFDPSWLSEATVGIGDSAGSPEFSIAPGAGDTFPGTMFYHGSNDLVGLGSDFLVGQDGILSVEFYESFNDFVDLADAQWTGGTMTITYVPEPAVAIDVTGIESWDEEGDPDNVVETFNIGPNAHVTSVIWDVTLQAFDPSFLSEMLMGFSASDGGTQLYIRPGFLDPSPGVMSYDLTIDLTAKDQDFSVGPDGILRTEFLEDFDDLVDDVDGVWVTGTVSIIAEEGEGCPGDCNGDGSFNILDFVCFQQEFQDGDPGADCNGDGSLNILDFVCFQQVFQDGCP